jgi:predicted DCC family thiol-disulfide oxidoreductase YuxK
MTMAATPASKREAEPSVSNSGATDFDVEVFYDGECPLCVREIDMLRRRDRRHRIRFTDIATDGFDAGAVGVSPEALMARLHGRLPDGTIIDGVEVFRRLYAAVGFEHAVRISRLPGVAPLLDAAYGAFAKRRLWLTGRCAEGMCAR